MMSRICGEYLEMPGLRLTCVQAGRLWGLEAETCLDLLEALVESRFLWRTRDGAYARLTDGTAMMPSRRMAKAEVTGKAIWGSAGEGRAAVSG